MAHSLSLSIHFSSLLFSFPLSLLFPQHLRVWSQPFRPTMTSSTRLVLHTHICTHSCTRTHVKARKHILLHTHSRTHSHTHTANVYISAFAHSYARTHTHTHTHTHAYALAQSYTHTHARNVHSLIRMSNSSVHSGDRR